MIRHPIIIDAFPINDELDILEMRLVEMADAVDFVIAVEADVSHQDQSKPYHLTEAMAASDRFDRWKGKLIVVRATDLPTVDEHPDPWAREHAQREWIQSGFADIPGLRMDDIIMQSDVDEIPRALFARNVRPGRNKLISFGMRGHFFAVDWIYPQPWFGTVAGTVKTLLGLGEAPFSWMRDARNGMPHPYDPGIPTAECPNGWLDAGWHISWVGGPERALKKVSEYCHPEVSDRILAGIDDELSFWRDGIHVDGLKMEPVDVDESWPKWIVDGNAPTNWYRPRS